MKATVAGDGTSLEARPQYLHSWGYDFDSTVSQR